MRFATSLDEGATTVMLMEVSPEVKNRIMLELFGKVDSSQIQMIDISLPKHAGNTLTKKKLSSLAKKYSSAPDHFLRVLLAN